MEPLVFPSREVYREQLLDLYAQHGEDALAELLFRICDEIGPDAFWIVHSTDDCKACCHVHSDDADKESPMWSGEAPTVSAAMVMCIEAVADEIRNGGTCQT